MVKQIAGDTIDITPDDVTELEDDNDADLSAIFASFGGAPDDKTYHLKIYRVIKDSAERAWLFNAVPSELPIDNRLRDEYKGGRFEIRIYEIKGGKHILRRRPNILIEAPQKPDVAQASDLTAVLKAFQDSQTQMFNQLSDVMKKSQGVVDVPANPFSMIKEMAAAMLSVREMMQPAAPSISPIEQLQSLAELMKTLKGDSDGGGETNFMDVIKTALQSPLLGDVLQGAANTVKNVQHVPAQIAPASPVQATGAAPVNNPTEEPQNVNIIQEQMIKGYVEMLVGRAARNSNPELVAELILEDVPEQVIREHLLAADALDKATAINQAVNQYRPWFEQLQNHLREFMTQPTGTGA